ncbi:hypothetical protein PS1_035029 [Malus domestica]
MPEQHCMVTLVISLLIHGSFRGLSNGRFLALGGARLMAHFVGHRDMSRVLEAEKPWLFQDDLVIVIDGAHHRRWAEPLYLASIWVQIHNVPLNEYDEGSSLYN